jgi:hypothetical protein
MSHADPFDVNAAFPADPKHRTAIEAMVVQAAEFAGCSPAVARDFADEVGAAFTAGASTAAPHASVGLRLERGADRIEVAVSCGDTVRISRPLTAAS